MSVKTMHKPFEQLCIRDDTGIAIDVDNVYQPKTPSNFDEVVYRVLSKIDTSILLLESHKGPLQLFSQFAIPMAELPFIQKVSTQTRIKGRGRGKLISKEENVLIATNITSCWEVLHEQGWHGMQIVALISLDSFPDNNSRKHPLEEFCDSLLSCLKANYMFQNPKGAYIPASNIKDLEGWEAASGDNIYFGIAFVWKYCSDNIKRSPIKTNGQSIMERDVVSPPKRSRLVELKKNKASTDPKQQNLFLSSTSEEDSDVEEEITFKQLSPLLKQKQQGEETTRLLNQLKEEEAILNQSLSGTPRKSLGRKSLAASEWLEEQKCEALNFFDGLNPAQPEQKRIALTCKYISMTFDKELSSKVLYSWVQKKGRAVTQPPETTFNLSEDQQKTFVLKFYQQLDTAYNETSRISLAIKYAEVQCGISLNSKQIFAWLNVKQKRNLKRK